MLRPMTPSKWSASAPDLHSATSTAHAAIRCTRARHHLRLQPGGYVASLVAEAEVAAAFAENLREAETETEAEEAAP